MFTFSCTLVSLLVLHVYSLEQLKCHYEYHETPRDTTRSSSLQLYGTRSSSSQLYVTRSSSSRLYDPNHPGLAPGFCRTNPVLGQKCSRWTSEKSGQVLESCYSCEELRSVMIEGDQCVDCMVFDLCTRRKGFSGQVNHV